MVVAQTLKSHEFPALRRLSSDYREKLQRNTSYWSRRADVHDSSGVSDDGHEEFTQRSRRPVMREIHKEGEDNGQRVANTCSKTKLDCQHWN